MLSGFPSELIKQGLSSDVRTVLQLYTLMSRGLVEDLGGIYSSAERLIVKDPRHKGPYTVAFFSYFLDIKVAPGQSMDAAVMESDAFNNWRREHAPDRVASSQLVDEFLDYVLNQKPDLKKLAAEIEQLQKDFPTLEVPMSPSGEDDPQTVEADHADKDLAEILKKMREIAKEQKEVHNGGKKYVGTRGTSPYGNNGKAMNGIRVDGNAQHLSARMVLNDPRYFPLNMNALLSDNNVDAALAALKGVAEKSSKIQLDIDETIRIGAKRRGLFIPQIRNEEEDRLNVILFIDNGGFSMDPYVSNVRSLFQKMKTRFSHEMRIFYFHNIIYDTVYKDEARMKYPISARTLLKEGQHHSVFILGDASMAPHELHGYGEEKSGYEFLRDMAEAFPKLAWLNPVAEGAWGHTETIGDIRRIAKMFPLTPRGIERAVTYLNQSTAKRIEER